MVPVIYEQPGHRQRFVDAVRAGDIETADAAIEAFKKDFVNNIVECPRCAQRNRVPMDTHQEFKRAVHHAKCGACKKPLFCLCGRCP